jgi:hypothetical protein
MDTSSAGLLPTVQSATALTQTNAQRFTSNIKQAAGESRLVSQPYLKLVQARFLHRHRTSIRLPLVWLFSISHEVSSSTLTFEPAIP